MPQPSLRLLLPLLLPALAPASAGGQEGRPVARLGRLPVTMTVVASGQAPVMFTTTLRNLAPSPTELRLAQPMEPDVVVFNAQGLPVWNCFHGQAIRTIDAPYVLQASEVRRFSCTWSGRGNDGQRLSAGRYRAQAWLHTADPSVPGVYRSGLVDVVLR